MAKQTLASDDGPLFTSAEPKKKRGRPKKVKFSSQIVEVLVRDLKQVSRNGWLIPQTSSQYLLKLVDKLKAMPSWAGTEPEKQLIAAGCAQVVKAAALSKLIDKFVPEIAKSMDEVANLLKSHGVK